VEYEVVITVGKDQHKGGAYKVVRGVLAVMNAVICKRIIWQLVHEVNLACPPAQMLPLGAANYHAGKYLVFVEGSIL